VQGKVEDSGQGGGGTARAHAPAWLVADIGGTNARFGWCADTAVSATGTADTAGTAGAANAATAPVTHVATLACSDYDGPAAAARAYLAQLALQLGPAYQPPCAAAFAVATAVSGDEVAFTNSGWAFSRRNTQADLGLHELVVLNDFEALALSLPHLQPQQLRTVGSIGSLQGVSPHLLSGVKAVVGPGTGLGVAAVVPTPAGWVAIPGEGGHASLASGNDLEAALLARVRQTYPHVSAERLLSGIGLPVLHQGLAQVLGQMLDAPLLARDIVNRGLAQGEQVAQDSLCSQTLDLFCALLGGFAGNVALTFGARGGLYIGGGIVPRLGSRFDASQFRARFEAKGRFEAYLQAIPTAVITDTLAALTGAASALGRR
jgi:glucokinase